MNLAEVAILVKAKDEASKVFSTIQSRASSLGSTLQKGLRTAAMAGGIALVGAAAAGIKFAGMASDLNESMSKVNVVFATSAKRIKDWSKDSARALGLSQQEALEYAGTLGNLFSALGLTQDQMVDMSKETVKLAADLASFNNISTTDALEKLRAGLVGEAEPLRALGVNINAAMVEAKALEMGLGGLNGELTEAAKVQARYALIMEQTSLAQGDFARTSDGLANQQRILSAMWKDLQADLGQAVLPLMTLLVTLMVERVVPALSDGAQALSDFITTIRAGLAGDITAAAEAFNKLPPPLQALALWLAEHRPDIESFAQSVRDLADDAIAGWITILVTLRPHLESLGRWLVEHQVVLIAVAVAAAGVAAVLIGWPAIFAAAGVSVGILTTRIKEWRRENEELDKTFRGLEITLQAVGFALRPLLAAIERATQLVADHKAAQIALTVALIAANAPLVGFLALMYAIGASAGVVTAAFNSIAASIQGVIDKVKAIPDLPDWVKKAGGIVGKAVDLAKDPLGLGGLGGRFAAGGISPGGPILVGERGWEIVAPPSGSRIFSHEDSMAMLAGGGGGRGGVVMNATFNMEFHGDVQRGNVRDEIREALDDWTRENEFRGWAGPSGGGIPN